MARPTLGRNILVYPKGVTCPGPIQTTPCYLYLALHVACAKVAHMSGAADTVMRDMEDIKVLAADGSSAKVLALALQLCAAIA
jgi:hypothetical protein